MGEGCRRGLRTQQCGLRPAHLAEGAGEALATDVQSPLEGANICTGGEGRRQGGGGKEGVRGEGEEKKKKVQAMENSRFGERSGADLPLWGGGVTERRPRGRYGFLQPAPYPLVGSGEPMKVLKH